MSLVVEGVRRNRAEQRVLRDRAALIKMALMSWRETEGGSWMAELDVMTDDIGYQCGRLLAVIEAVQRAALGKINATVVDRFYGTASAAPIAVFPRLCKGARPHLAKLRRERPGVFGILDRRMEEIAAPFTENFPRVLTLEQQGLFALGYYHQRAADRREIAERIARKALAAGPADEDDFTDDDV